MHITSVFVERAEGPTELCKSYTFSNVPSAEAYLRKGAYTAPATGGYDKHDFKITFSDGDTYEGRIDLERKHVAGYSIRDHVIGYMKFLAGERKPAHMTEREYQSFLTRTGSQDEAKAWLNTYSGAF